MIDVITNVLIAGVVAVPTTAAAFGGAYSRLRRTASDVAEAKAKIDEHEKQDVAQHTAMIDRLARIETKLDQVLERR